MKGLKITFGVLVLLSCGSAFGQKSLGIHCSERVELKNNKVVESGHSLSIERLENGDWKAQQISAKGEVSQSRFQNCSMDSYLIQESPEMRSLIRLNCSGELQDSRSSLSLNQTLDGYTMAFEVESNNSTQIRDSSFEDCIVE